MYYLPVCRLPTVHKHKKHNITVHWNRHSRHVDPMLEHRCAPVTCVIRMYNAFACATATTEKGSLLLQRAASEQKKKR